MQDPNLPQDMQTQPPPARRKKQLPSLQGTGDETLGATSPAAESRPRRTRKLPTMEGPAPTAADAAAADPADPAAGTVPRPRKKKRKPQPSTGAGDGSPDHGTAPISPQQQLLPTADADADAAGAPAPAGRPHRKKNRKPAATGEARPSPEGQETDGTPVAATTSPVARTRYIDVEGMPLAKALETVREDVVTRGEGGRVNLGADLTDGGGAGGDEDGGPPMRRSGGRDEDEDAGQLGGAGRHAGESNMSDTIFWQTQDARTFKAEKMDKYQLRLEQERKEREQYLEGVVEEDTSNRTLKCAIGFTKVYNYLGTVLLGLMPGFAILHTGYVWTLSSSYQAFLLDYSELSSPMPILYYVVLTLIMLSVLDRYDTGKLDRKSCLDCASFRHAGMVVLLYAPAYVVSNAMYPTDQWIRRYTFNTTAYAGISNGDNLVQSWRIMDAVRSVCLVLGWLVVAFNTQFNKLADNLETELDDLIGEDQHMEMGGTKAMHGTATAKGVTMA